MNTYVRDGASWLRRAAALINEPGPPWMPDPDSWLVEEDPDAADRVHDAVLFFAFGVEKLARGILYDVNPLFVLKNPDFDNVCGFLYTHRLTPAHQKGVAGKNASKKATPPDRDVHGPKTTLLRAASFSVTIQKSQATLEQLFAYRGAIAHQSSDDFDAAAAMRYTRKYFSPVVEGLLAELSLDPSDVFDKERRELLGKVSKAIHAEDAFVARMEKLIADHAAKWQKLQEDEAAVRAAERKTDAELATNLSGDRFVTDGVCPACAQAAVLYCEVEGEYMDGEAVTTGASAQSLACHFCGLRLDGYEEVDHFDLSGQLYARWREESEQD